MELMITVHPYFLNKNAVALRTPFAAFYNR